MNAPRFSFLTTVHGTARYLPEMIESVLAQDDPDWELIVVDNGRSDAVVEAVARFTDPRIRLLRQHDAGYAGGVMAAAAASRGTFVSVLDSDDLLTADYTAVMGGFIDTHPGADAIGCDAHRFSDDTRAGPLGGYFTSIGGVRMPRNGRLLDVEHLLAGIMPYYGGVVRRTAWETVGGYGCALDAEPDVVLWLRLAESFEVHVISAKLARCRVHGTSLSRDPSLIDGFERRLIRSFEVYAAEYGRAHPQWRGRRSARANVRRLKFHRALRQARWALVHDDDIAGARRHAREAFGYRPGVRAAAVVSVVTLVPRVARELHPAKQYMAAMGRRGLSAVRRRLVTVAGSSTAERR